MYSSLSSFYIPCIIMVFLYWNIFKVSSAQFPVNSIGMNFIQDETP